MRKTIVAMAVVVGMMLSVTGCTPEPNPPTKKPITPPTDGGTKPMPPKTPADSTK